MTVAGDATSRSTDRARLVEEYELLRTDVGAVELARDVLRVSGVDTVEYLQGQLSQDVGALGVGESADSLLLTPQGKLDALVRVSRTGDDEVVLDVQGGFGESVATRLARFKLRVKVVVEPLPWRCVALRGPRAVAQLAKCTGTSLTPVFSWNGVSGVDMLGASPAIEGVRLCSGQAWESVRVEAGIPVMGAELDERTIAAEADLLDRAVSFTKGCYTGQELVARLDARGNKLARHLRGLVVGPVLDALDTVDPTGVRPAIPAPGSEIVVEGRVVGSVTSSAWSPALRCPVALGYVHRTVAPSTTVELRAVGAQAHDVAHSARLVAEVRELPLV